MLDDILPIILQRADTLDPTFGADEVGKWPDDTTVHMTSLGLLRPDTHRRSIVCDACAEGHLEEVIWVEDKSKQPCAYIRCPEAGPVGVPSDRLKCWAIDFDRLTRLIAAGLSLTGKRREFVKDRAWRLGYKQFAGTNRPCFLMRGLGWPDGQMVAEQTPCSDTSIVFALDRLPLPEIWPNGTPAMIEFTNVASLTEHGFEFDCDQLADTLRRTVSFNRVTVDISNSIITLNGKSYAVTPDQAFAVKALVDANGGWVSSHQMKLDPMGSGRIDRILHGRKTRNGSRKGGLPELIQEVILSKSGAGYRLLVS